ncbi:MAG: hypothetical protein HXX15_00665 [Rhodopseudomonas sp.]|uniref:hypothetical protein n=1 Tax=Rhodopseudomonas sp. TaxID=1078 RepID=UPI00181D69CC|nr:hypothetical protein [Rhodopseudomonas sp.]NVN84572.1 hypothetical protein [Rhodopseudomonas sp.]
MALLSPDEYAWRLFVALNWPARSGSREPDPSKKLGDAGRVVWESWKLVSGGPAKSEVYRTGGADPTDWDSPLDAYCDATARDIAPLQNLLVRRRDISILFEPGVAQPGTDEVRMNLDTFTFIKGKQIFNIEGQEALFNGGVASIQFPAGAKEIKAQWREISAADEARYHSCRSNGKLYGLTALHILTKDLPNWYWATFEHVDNKKPENQGKPGYGPWLLTSKDAFSCPPDHLDCEEFPKGIGLDGTKWQNYLLRGSQIDFVESTGSPTRLANSQIETDFQTTSSCISCHARASIGPRIATSKPGNRLLIFDAPFADSQILTPFGSPDPNMFVTVSGATGQPIKALKFTQLDFVWSLFRAQRRAP